MMTVKKTVIVFLGYLFLLSAAIAVEEQDAQPPPQEDVQAAQQNNCECPVPLERYDQCVADYWQQHEAAKALEQQLQEVQGQVHEKAHLEGELRGQVEQCQGQVAQLEGQRETHETEVARLQAKAEKLQSQLQERAVALDEAHNMAHASRRELEQTQKELESMKQGRSIITVDVDLLQERLQEIKAIIMDYCHDFLTLCQGYWEVAKEKMADFWKYLETKVFPEIKRVMEDDVLPVCQQVYHDGVKYSKKAYRKTSKFVKDTYAPYREPVNQKLDHARVVWNENYQKHLEPKVKEYKLDQYAAQGKTQFLQYKDQAKVYVDQGHEQLVESIRLGSKDALKYAKSQDGPDFLVEHLTVIHDRRHDFARYMEYMLGFLVFYIFYRLFFGGGKKKKGSKGGKPKRTKADWEKEQQMKNGGKKPISTAKGNKPKGGGGSGKKK